MGIAGLAAFLLNELPEDLINPSTALSVRLCCFANAMLLNDLKAYQNFIGRACAVWSKILMGLFMSSDYTIL